RRRRIASTISTICVPTSRRSSTRCVPGIRSPRTSCSATMPRWRVTWRTSRGPAGPASPGTTRRRPSRAPDAGVGRGGRIDQIAVMANRTATAVLQIGCIAVVFLALPYKLFELDRYFVPKELALHVAALLVAILLFVRARSMAIDLADMLMALFLVWSLAS